MNALQASRDGRGVPVPPVERLVRDGARFVLLTGEGKPAWRGWLRNRRPWIDQVLGWIEGGELVGVVPATVEGAVADVDAGDPGQLTLGLDGQDRPLTVATPRGEHQWYRAPGAELTRLPFRDVGGCSGDLIGDRQYVRIHLTGWRLYEFVAELADRVAGGTLPELPRELQPDLLRSAGVLEPPALDAPRSVTRADVAVEDLGQLAPGNRNAGFLAYMRRWLWRQPRAGDPGDVEAFAAWMANAERHATAAYSAVTSRDVGEPYTLAEALDTARSAARWVWERADPRLVTPVTALSTDPQSQRRRGVKREHGTGGAAAVEAVEACQAGMVAAYRDGRTEREIAAWAGLSRRRVRVVLDAAGVARRRTGPRAIGKPWEALGMSRSTWFRKGRPSPPPE